MERKNAVTLHGKALTLIGAEIKIGQKLPNFNVVDEDVRAVTAADFRNKTKVIASLPSLDTPVCDLEIKRFNKEATALSSDIIISFVSMDLPFALKRFCLTNDITAVKTYSDHRDASFGMAFGVLIKELRLLARAVFIVDKNDIVRYVEYVKEVASQPDYEAALQALRCV